LYLILATAKGWKEKQWHQLACCCSPLVAQWAAAMETGKAAVSIQLFDLLLLPFAVVDCCLEKHSSFALWLLLLSLL